MSQRTVDFLGKEMHLVENQPKLGDKIHLHGTKFGTFDCVSLPREHKYLVLGTFPSADTSVCDMQILKMADLSTKYTNFDFVGISVDLPTALKNYVDNHKVERVQLYSDYLNKKVLKQLGVLMDEVQISARGLFVFDENNTLLYQQVNKVTTEMVDFDALIEHLDKLA